MEYEINVINASKHKYLPKRKVQELLKKVFTEEDKKTAKVNVIFIDTEEIISLNRQYLNHDYATDVMAFSFEDKEIDGEIYICPEVAKQQAIDYSVSTENELLRLAAHGALHLVGYNDNTEDKRKIMQDLETKYISK